MSVSSDEYRQLVGRIFALGRFGMKPGLERIKPLLRNLGNPEEAFTAVHVAGTNGKGSTASFLAAILKAGGISAGLFTSPHLISFTERFRIDGAEIDEDKLSAVAERVLAAAPPATTFFEVATAVACLHFAESGVSLAVLEAGMGGRYDATNAISGALAIFTPVSLDHGEYLGRTVAAIAADKAGIIKPGKPVVSALQDRDAAAVISDCCAEKGSPLSVEGEAFSVAWSDDGLDYRGIGLDLPGLLPGIGGRYQASNAAAALAAAELLSEHCGVTVNRETMIAGIRAARWPGRMEFFPGDPLILLDGAHNPAGAVALAGELALIKFSRLIMVVGVMGDKDSAGILDPLLRLADTVIAVSPQLERALPAELLARQIVSLGFPCKAAGRVANGISLAREIAEKNDLVLVCGSLFVVGEARGLLTGRVYEPIRG